MVAKVNIAFPHYSAMESFFQERNSGFLVNNFRRLSGKAIILRKSGAYSYNSLARDANQPYELI